jgi:hypothetical protein
MESTEYSLPEIVYSLNAMATNLGTHKNASVLKHAAILLTMQSERIKDLEEDFTNENDERIKMENAIFKCRQALATISDELDYSRPVRQPAAVDLAPFKNVMAYHGVAPYAKKKRSTS